MRIQITENDIRKMVNECIKHLLQEDVFANAKLLNKKKGTIGLTYDKHKGKNAGNIASFDMLNTEKMDESNEDTFIVPLKGGIDSYNITSIKGTEVMHYFKRRFEKSAATTTIKKDGVDLTLDMKNDEFERFIQMFLQKVGRVVNYCTAKFKKENKEFSVNAVSVYPVPSSSSFNETMAKQIAGMQISGLPVKTINKDLLVKDLRNLQRDEDFIEKNKDYYNGMMSNVDDEYFSVNSVSTFLDNDINKFKAFSQAEKYIDEMNTYEKKILETWNNYKTSEKKNGIGSVKTLKSLVAYYKKYYDSMMNCVHKTKYQNLLKGDSESGFHFDTVAKALKYTKGPSVEGRSGELWELLKPLLRGQKSDVTGKPYKKVDINQWKKNQFQIKNLSNGERMGMKNIYNPNSDVEKVQEELNKIKGTVFVIFDDNISGGATLSDVCYQCKELGIEYIIPITFGVMDTKWQMNRIPLCKPMNDKGEEGFNY